MNKDELVKFMNVDKDKDIELVMHDLFIEDLAILFAKYEFMSKKNNWPIDYVVQRLGRDVCNLINNGEDSVHQVINSKGVQQNILPDQFAMFLEQQREEIEREGIKEETVKYYKG